MSVDGWRPIARAPSRSPRSTSRWRPSPSRRTRNGTPRREAARRSATSAADAGRRLGGSGGTACTVTAPAAAVQRRRSVRAGSCRAMSRPAAGREAPSATRRRRPRPGARSTTVQQRVLWLAASIVHHANRVRPNRSGVKVGGHQASSASMVSLMTALWFGVLRGARPRERQAARLAGAARHQLPARAPRPALPHDAAPVRRAAVLPLAHEGPGPRRLLHRLGRPRRHGADLGRARPPLRRRPLRRAGRRPPDRADRRRRARRGRVLGGDRRPDGAPPRRGHVGRRPQPPVARPRRARHRRRAAAATCSRRRAGTA